MTSVMLDEIKAQILPLSSVINLQEDRYAGACCILVLLLSQVKLGLEDKQDLLADVSDILDNLPPSARSGLKGVRVSGGRSRTK
jgi:hypothetical protein